MSSLTHDVITTEVHRKALENLTNEMGIALLRTSGSPVVVDAKDFSTCLMDRTPEHLGFAAYVLFHLGTSLVGTERIVDLVAKSGQELRPGDGWIINDPIAGGAAHQGDVAVIMPMFYSGQHLGWGFVNMHVLDIGGAGLSGIAPDAHDVYGEGLRFSAVRAIRDGVIEPEWEAFISDNVRAAGPVLNDLRSMIAANNVGNRKLNEIVDSFGLEAHEEYCRINKDLTEEVLRGRIEKLPDGAYEAVEWNEFDGHGLNELQEMGLRMEISGSEMKLEFSGVPQSGGFVNTGKGSIWGQAATALLTTLAYGDMPVNGGLWRPLTIDLGEPGTVVNATVPAPVSYGHAEVGMRACKLVKDVLNQSLSLSSDPVLRGRVAGKGNDAPLVSALYGSNQHDTVSVVIYLDNPVGIGGPAQPDQDGQDAYGCTSMTGCGLSDLESHEGADPLLFLWREVVSNSGGPGQFRGGQGLEQGFCMAYTDQMAGPVINVCAHVPPSGFGGAFPAGTSSHYILRESNVRELLAEGKLGTKEVLQGRREDLANKVGHVRLDRDDVYIMVSGGGSGLGDPLLRDVDRVRADVVARYVTAEHAAAVYGVILANDRSIDPAATADRRREIREQRISGTPKKDLQAPRDVGVAVLTDGSAWSCGSCGGALGSTWREGAVVIENEIAARFGELDMYVRPRPEKPMIVLREHYCPACAAALGADVLSEGAPGPAAPVLW